ncbi:MAG: SBBP repeat-containing protein, partial [Chloroflexi bacterium]|nr:SBBP repeat-containing protein [Chloroflexota bacterium]
GDGSILWTTQIGIAGKQTSATGVAVDSGGNIYVIGTTNGAFPTKTYSGGGEDAIVVKLASDGTQI